MDEYIASLIRLVSIHTNNFTLCIISIIHMIYYTFWAILNLTGKMTRVMVVCNLHGIISSFHFKYVVRTEIGCNVLLNFRGILFQRQTHDNVVKSLPTVSRRMNNGSATVSYI